MTTTEHDLARDPLEKSDLGGCAGADSTGELVESLVRLLRGVVSGRSQCVDRDAAAVWTTPFAHQRDHVSAPLGIGTQKSLFPSVP